MGLVNIEDRLVYSNEVCTKIKAQIKVLGSVELVLCKMFAPPCSEAQAHEYAVTVAPCLEMTEEQFMEKFKALRLTAVQRLNAASKFARTDSQSAGLSGSSRSGDKESSE